MPEIAVLIATALIKYGPEVAQGIATILHKNDPTLADWEAVFAKVKTYDEYVAPKPNA